MFCWFLCRFQFKKRNSKSVFWDLRLQDAIVEALSDSILEPMPYRQVIKHKPDYVKHKIPVKSATPKPDAPISECQRSKIIFSREAFLLVFIYHLPKFCSQSQHFWDNGFICDVARKPILLISCKADNSFPNEKVFYAFVWRTSDIIFKIRNSRGFSITKKAHPFKKRMRYIGFIVNSVIFPLLYELLFLKYQ